MHYEFLKRLEGYVPEHVRPVTRAPEKIAPIELKAAIDDANLTEMWDMILTLDYSVSDPTDLSPEKRDEFLNVMSLLLKAFDR
ncbi:hypothetical protein Q669_23920 [Labrenzia sp. C1B10]|jgi:hypothetical protein|uniref:hypothetical protein n=1 Tax=Stappiaceae TaxID=2821832 RepID=UPI0003B8F326|nr:MULTISPECIES: hypothetical protein [unclassified Labrenzia]ERP98246.1 hypothetical protein Q669_23920 [Labrenzia sp. C1B10]ERS02038.1 hypothetical protein Q675_08035 [Labrenzia sp. C1B70]MEC9472090.1 hypothetical protein [Pseudomonadota bacterium]